MFGMLKLPRLSHPLAKSLRTLEGWLVVAANIALAVVSAATNSLPAGTAAKYAAGLNLGYAICRSLLKGLASAGNYGLPIPTQLAPGTLQQLETDAAALTTGAVKLLKPTDPPPDTAVKASGPPAATAAGTVTADTILPGAGTLIA